MQATRKIDYTDILFWFGLLMIVGWVIAKALGLIP